MGGMKGNARTATIRIPTFEELGLERTNPDDTYIGSDDANECWIGEKWDIARRGPYWDVYRKGNHFAHVHNAEVARLIVADEVLWPHGIGASESGKDDAPDSECYTLPNGECVAPVCKLHGPVDSGRSTDV